MTKKTKTLTLAKKHLQQKDTLISEVTKRLGSNYQLKDFTYSTGMKQFAIPALYQKQQTVIIVKQSSPLKPFLIGLLLMLSLAGGFALWQKNQHSRGNMLPESLAPDLKDAKDIDKAELMKRMQKEVDEGYVNLQINTQLIFNKGDEYGTIQAVNPEANKSIISFDVFLDDTDELLYSSGSILPGQYINKGKLTRALAKGTYKGYAYVKMFDETTKKEQNASKVTMAIQINS